MTLVLKKSSKQVLILFIGITLILPLVIMGYESIILGKKTVVFLAGYPAFVSTSILVYYALLILMGIAWGGNQIKSLLSLKNEKAKNELLHLQSQVSPHFFFNMLNNIYGTIDTDPETTKRMVLKLSDLMRYSIYEGEKNQVTLDEELAFIKNYMELHQMRYQKTIDIHWTTNVASENIHLTPLLLIILVENAFKHGVEKLREKAYVHITIQANERHIDFKIENNYEPDDIDGTGGLGLKNIKRRLALLYPNQYQLKIDRNSTTFTAHLTLSI